MLRVQWVRGDRVFLFVPNNEPKYTTYFDKIIIRLLYIVTVQM